MRPRTDKPQSDLTVVTKAKDLGSYIMTITQKSPKQFRFTFVSRMQNLALEVIDRLYRANEKSGLTNLQYDPVLMKEMAETGYQLVMAFNSKSKSIRRAFEKSQILRKHWSKLRIVN